jgi:hypothetical protein
LVSDPPIHNPQSAIRNPQSAIRQSIRNRNRQSSIAIGTHPSIGNRNSRSTNSTPSIRNPQSPVRNQTTQ